MRLPSPLDLSNQRLYHLFMPLVVIQFHYAHEIEEVYGRHMEGI